MQIYNKTISTWLFFYVPLIQRATEERKRQIHEADLSRKENKALTELELEARDRAQALVERANALRMEQEEEIKQFNLVGSSCRPLKLCHKMCLKVTLSIIVSTADALCVWSPQLILGAQCQATRDFQIHEKKQIQAELSEEEKRLDAGMEVERRKALETVQQIDELRKQQRIRWGEIYWEIHIKSMDWFAHKLSWKKILLTHPNHPHPSNETPLLFNSKGKGL